MTWYLHLLYIQARLLRMNLRHVEYLNANLQ